MTPEHWDAYVFSLVDLSGRAARKRFRQSIQAAWSHSCAYCGRSSADDQDLALTLDHVRSRSRGGENLRSNLVPACRRCNQAKGSMDWTSWFRSQEFHCPEREQVIQKWLEPRPERHPLSDWGGSLWSAAKAA